MHDSVKMVVVLLVIGAICGGLLAGVNAWTGPIIEVRAQQEFMETVGRFFPDVVKIDEEVIGDEEFFICYDNGGNLLGVVGQVKAKGYGDDPINYNLALDNTGKIVGIRISSHTETPGIGNFIERDDWQQQIVGLNFNDPIAVGQDIDTRSGATVTLRGISGSIRRVADVIGGNFLGFEVETIAVDIAAVGDGTYTGTGTGFKSEVTVEVTVSGGKITEIVVLEHDDTAAFWDRAETETISRIIAAQSLEIDAVSGATGSSNGIIKAVFDALK
jgi:uncharacterized protein with FMN-binding domain